ncbi:MAG: Carboxypeptidase regulatory-like domain [Bacteroidota bacterium]|jgi:hypothetical protein
MPLPDFSFFARSIRDFFLPSLLKNSKIPTPVRTVKTRLIHLLLLPFLFLLGMHVHAQTGGIKGRLLLDQSPIPDETVVLKNAEGRIVNGTMTDEFGSFQFRDVPPGTYIVVGKYKDFEAEVECVVNAGESLPVSLQCKKKSLFQWIPGGNLERKNLPVYTCIPALEGGDAVSHRKV